LFTCDMQDAGGRAGPDAAWEASPGPKPVPQKSIFRINLNLLACRAAYPG
jgi:hypothetical protein